MDKGTIAIGIVVAAGAYRLANRLVHDAYDLGRADEKEVAKKFIDRAMASGHASGHLCERERFERDLAGDDHENVTPMHTEN